jgi:hypothetical protein
LGALEAHKLKGLKDPRAKPTKAPPAVAGLSLAHRRCKFHKKPQTVNTDLISVTFFQMGSFGKTTVIHRFCRFP